MTIAAIWPAQNIRRLPWHIIGIVFAVALATYAWSELIGSADVLPKRTSINHFSQHASFPTYAVFTAAFMAMLAGFLWKTPGKRRGAVAAVVAASLCGTVPFLRFFLHHAQLIDLSFWQLLSLPEILANALAFGLLLLWPTFNGTMHWVQRATASLILVSALMWWASDFFGGSIANEYWPGMLQPPLAGAALVGVGLVLVALFRDKSSLLLEEKGQRAMGLTFQLECARCRETILITNGRGRCGGCSLELTMEVKEAACAGCGYLLRGLTSGRCPECGLPTI